MRYKKKPGVIINLGSASGLYPLYADPIYSGTKGLTSPSSFGLTEKAILSYKHCSLTCVNYFIIAPDI